MKHPRGAALDLADVSGKAQTLALDIRSISEAIGQPDTAEAAAFFAELACLLLERCSHSLSATSDAVLEAVHRLGLHAAGRLMPSVTRCAAAEAFPDLEAAEALADAADLDEIIDVMNLPPTRSEVCTLLDGLRLFAGADADLSVRPGRYGRYTPAYSGILDAIERAAGADDAWKGGFDDDTDRKCGADAV